MNIHFFTQVMNYLKQEAESGKLVSRYKEFLDALEAVSRSSESVHADNLIEAKVNLINYLVENDPERLGLEAYELFKKFDRFKVFGKPAAIYLDELTQSKAGDFIAVHTAISNRLRALKKQLNIISQFYEVFDQSVLNEMLSSSENDELMPGLYLYFEGGVSVENLSDLDRYTRIWKGILQSFIELTGHESQIPEFKNYPDNTVVLGVALDEITLEAFMQGSHGILSSLYIIDKIRKIQMELSTLLLTNNYQLLLEEEIEGVIENTASAVVDELIGKFCNSDSEDVYRISANLNRSLKQILNFAEKGGRFECKPANDSVVGDALNKALTDAFIAIKEFLPSSFSETGDKTVHAREMAH